MISVIMPVFNCENDVPNAIQSILKQTYEDFEFLILNDGSSDSTGDILESYRKIDERVKIFNNKSNIGLTKSLNILINKARGEYLARQDSDDISHPKRFEQQLKYMSMKKLPISTTRAKIKNSNKKIPGLTYFLPHELSIKFKNPYIHGSLVIETSLMRKIGGYDEDFYYAQDYKLFSDILKSNQKIGMMKECLYVLNTQNNLSTIYKNEQNIFAKAVRRNTKPFRSV
ncbi:MAG: glycosyltransferase family 2 protein [Flavobacteriaceae bacterium]|nr:glycosyltransferase family 2 protein [Flavobacteriaceae bacterium]